MSMFHPYWQCKYDEMITYYPRYYREVFEMDAILRAEGALLDGIQTGIDRVLDDAFVETADETAITLWENLLGMAHDSTLTIEQRRAMVLARLLGSGHIGEPEIRQVVSCYTEESIMVDFAAGVIELTIDGELFHEESLLLALLKKIPAHLRLFMRIHIRRIFRRELAAAYSAVDRTFLTGNPKPVKRTLAASTEPAGGFYCQSHITARRIE